MRNKALVAETLGTLILVFIGVGAAVLSGDVAGGLGIALAFGVVLAALIYALGPISGAHFNPAVTLAMLMTKRLSKADAIGYWIAQFVGATVGAALLFLVVHLGPSIKTHEAFGTNGYGDRSALHTNVAGALVVEIMLTAIFVFVILAVTSSRALPGIAGVAIGGTLVVMHMVGLPLTGTGLNPARSLGPAFFAAGGALTQVWVFILAPLAGGAVAAYLHRMFAEA